MTRYAIAVQDGSDLRLFLSLARDSQGDVYVFWPISQDSEWQPHSSYHESGVRHHKSFNKALMRHRLQALDASFTGTEQIISAPIYLRGVRAINKPCRPKKYKGGVFIVDAGEISFTPASNERPNTAVAIDLVSPGAPPLAHPNSTIRRHVFTDGLPHLSVTLWDQCRMFDDMNVTPPPVVE